MIYGVSSKKFVAVIFLTCIRVYSLDLLAVTAGTIVIGVGIKLIRELSGLH